MQIEHMTEVARRASPEVSALRRLVRAELKRRGKSDCEIDQAVARRLQDDRAAEHGRI